MANLNGELKQLDIYTEEELLQKKETLTQLQAQEKQAKTDLETKEKEFQELNKLKELFDNKTKYQQELEELETEKASYIKREKRTENYQKAKLYFESSILREKDLVNSIQKRLEKLNSLSQELSEVNTELEKNITNWESIKKDYATIDAWQRQTQEYAELEDIISYQKQAKELENKIATLESQLKQNEADHLKIALHISELEKTTQELKAQQPSNIFVFNEVGEWFQVKKNLDNQIADWELQSKTLLERIQNGKSFFLTLSFSYENWKAEYEIKKAKLKQILADSQAKKIELSTKIELHQYAQNLQEGDPCPLCGASHHPNLLTNDKNIALDIQNIDATIAQTNTSLDQLENTRDKANQYEASINSFETQVENFNANISKNQKSLLEHQSLFKWNEFDSNDESAFLRKKQNADNNLNEINRLELETSKIRKEYETRNETINTNKISIVRIKEQYQNIVENIAIALRKIVINDKETVLQYSSDEVHKLRIELEKKLENTKQQYEYLQKNIQQLDKQKGILESTIQSHNHEKSVDTEELESLNNKIQERLNTHQFPSKNIVENILEERIDVARELQLIQNYKNNVFATEQKLNETNNIIKNQTFDSIKWVEIANKINTAKESITEFTTLIAQHTQSINLLTTNLETQKKLQMQLQEKVLRKDNIQTLKNLFAGSGFVNFISSVYLKNLCIAANERFSKLTQNQLHLELSVDNDFLIRDLLNDGKTRSVKTLSGGQTFQASLSLALALADSVQYQNKSEQNFFFLDEGFGALDKDALTTIYETLKDLRKENRIVGIISHVEDLQQEIPVSLLVKNDDENGSQIQLTIT
ncbi:MAG: hypothetical protein DI598_07450 [Pseudopedobacter saltans]|uniref:Exonuclease SbcC n=1 Tax=Pseudopedobacter saltans TaxID=151895 RepID=A0A2W5F7H7_9SPHI|nr:MAG: hypothetical protein DI598_07450 [Pseudopedobacter saltans]